MRAPALAFLVLALPAYAIEPQLARVTLSSGGVGQFEFTAGVDGSATVPLDVPLDQVDDILKSLRVDDPAGGMPTLRLPGRQPLAESFRTLPFPPSAFASAEALLAALVGEGVRLPGGATGAILAVTPFELVQPNNGGTTTRHRLTIATATGLETAVLEDTPGLEFTSEPLRSQVAAGLAAIALQRVQDRRTVALTLGDGGPRTVRFGYVVPAPVWKASYRLTVPADGVAGPALLQGFAVVENLSGRAWQGTEVVLTAGQPVLYRQALYEAVFTTRPEAPVDVPNRLTPQLDQGAVPEAAQSAPPSPVVAPAPMSMARGRAQMEAAPAPPLPPAEVRQSVAQVEFRLASPVNAAPGETLMLAITNRPIPARRVALYQPGTNSLHPLVALLLTNDGAGALPPGLVTLFERTDTAPAFIGDARLPTIQPGEDRLASFAADLAVRVDVARETDTLLVSGRAARGILELTRRERAVTTYRVTTPASSGRTMLIEQPKREGWTLTEPASTTTPTAHRITRDVPPGITDAIRVVQERPRGERVTLGDTPTPRLLALATEGTLSPALRAGLTRMASLRADLDRKTDAQRVLRERRTAILLDQDRLRSNLGAVPSGSELQRRYLGQMQAQETELDRLGVQEAAANRAVNEADTALKDAVAGVQE